MNILFPTWKSFGVEDIKETFEELGYKVFAQLVSVTTYTKESMLELIELVNDIKPYAVFISDDFGMMSREKILYYYKMIERLLNSNIYIGFQLYRYY